MPDFGGDDSDDEESDEEEDYDLREVSSDVEIDPAELMDEDNSEEDDSQYVSPVLLCTILAELFPSRFEEIVDEPPAEAVKPKKRTRESDVAGTDGEGEAGKKKQKKQKSADVPTTNGEAKDTGKAAKEEKKADKKEKKEKKEKTEKKEEKTIIPKDLVVEDKKDGTGKAAKKGDLVSMRYIGKFQDSRKVFDSNTKGKPVCFPCSFLYSISNG